MVPEVHSHIDDVLYALWVFGAISVPFNAVLGSWALMMNIKHTRARLKALEVRDTVDIAAEIRVP